MPAPRKSSPPKDSSAKLGVNADEPRLSRGRTRAGAIFPAPAPAVPLPADYATTLQEIKSHLRSARIRAVLAANPVVIESYWHTGKIILARQKESVWGAKVIDRLAADLQAEFPDMSGLSSRNLLAMKVFAREFPDGPIAQQLVAHLPWGHLLQIMQRLKDPVARDFYIRPLSPDSRRPSSVLCPPTFPLPSARISVTCEQTEMPAKRKSAYPKGSTANLGGTGVNSTSWCDSIRKDDDARGQIGAPPKDNANFTGMQHLIHHLSS